MFSMDMYVYTLIGNIFLHYHKSVGETGRDLMRPYLHEFLTTAYTFYDIVIWSATDMKWIKAKMSELGVLNHPSYRITFMLDSLAMISVNCQKYGLVNVKPLGVIWKKFDQWSDKNTIMMDDIRRNFIMNPQSGLKIRPFKNAHQNRDTDKELLRLSKYLTDISTLDDFTILNHNRWEKFRIKSKRKHPESDSKASSHSS
ncbi:DgyrCDS5591 [Dimorphilus gyrociliatus]|uniref:DgyrCDS5591 n=1 Tax=Dimorphilus gyrociliatus TaxID=2664684 RepID=A0A7I8VM01_9ANNE|nr:DgyrCDS5591 [Dimorphilus gyrociliatus]